MTIAIQCADLDAERIDGTRVYIRELLNRFGSVAPDERFLLWHRGVFNPQLEPKHFPNYVVKALPFPFYWTQIRFAFELLRVRPERLWMPMQAIPFVRPKGMETVVTIHDLAFRKFPEHFPKKDLRRLSFFTDRAILKSDRIIAVSESTKRDILAYYPNIREEKVKVVYHGWGSGALSVKRVATEEKNASKDSRYTLHATRYILYIGAIQPRKNLERLIRAFELLKKDSRFGDVKLVLAGERAWLWENIVRAAQTSEQKDAIVLTGPVSFAERETLYQNASVFAFPSLYEGFGLPILEAFGHGVPVVCSNNSSLPEVGGDAALYCDPLSEESVARSLAIALEDKDIRTRCISRGHEQLANFSWDICARQTMDWIRG